MINHTIGADLWLFVNNIHASVAKKLRSIDPVTRRNMVEKLFASANFQLDYLDQVLLNNLQHLKETKYKDFDWTPLEQYCSSDMIISNMDMVLVQMAFFTLFIMSPEQYGNPNCDPDDLMCFVHLWRTIGFYLGIPEDINAGAFDTLEEARSFAIETMSLIVIPCAIRLDEKAIYMGKTVAMAHNLDYHVIMYTHLKDLGVELEFLWQAFSIGQKMKFYINRIVTSIYSKSMIRTTISKLFLDFSTLLAQKITGNTELQGGGGAKSL